MENILQQVTYQMTRGVIPFLLLVFGTLGPLGNFNTFTAPSLRHNSCALYLLSTSAFELLTVCFGLISRIADQFGSLLQSQSRIYCKIRYYFALTFPSISTYLLLMTAIDRCMSTSVNPDCRVFSRRKVAQRMIPSVITFCMVACSHTLIFVDHRPACIPQPGPYALFYSVFLIIFASVLPNVLLMLFALFTIRNVRKVRNRVAPTVSISQQQRRKQKTDTQFIVMVVSQAIISCLIDISRISCYAYYLLAANPSKSSYEQTVDTFIFQFSIVLSYFNYSKSFYSNLLTSVLFRNLFYRMVCRRCRRFIAMLKRCI